MKASVMVPTITKKEKKPKKLSTAKGAVSVEYAILTILIGATSLAIISPLENNIKETLRVATGTLANIYGPLPETEEPEAPAPMILTFDGDAGIRVGGLVQATIEWGDGTQEEITSGGIYTHSYHEPGPHQVKITGTVELFGTTTANVEPGDHNTMSNLTSIVSFGDLGLRSLDYALYRANRIQSLPTELPASIKSLEGFMFKSEANPSGLEQWNTSKIESLFVAFSQTPNFNRDIGSWDTSSVTDMSYAFEYTTAFNANIGNWDTSAVTDFSGMFQHSSSFNQPIGSWDTSSAVKMDWMFINAPAFNQDIGTWDTSSVTSFEYMILDATSFNQDLSGWCVSQFPSKPAYWDQGAVSYTLPRPVWGTCP